MITFKTGNILDATENIIVQSVNHQAVMGAGLAKQIVERWPDVYTDYAHVCNAASFESIKRNGIFSVTRIDPSRLVICVFGQDYFGMDKQHTDYVALGNGIDQVMLYAQSFGYSVAIPYGIGCGLGGGDWDVVFDIISRCSSAYPEVKTSIYKYEKGR